MLITNATALIDGQWQEDTCVRFENNIIVEIGKNLKALHEPVRDFAGDALIPGFVDVHIHAFMGRDTMQGEEAVRHMSRELKKVGVSAFLPTTMSASVEETYQALAGIAAVMRSPEKEGALVLGAHMEAPFLQGEKCGAQKKEYFLPPTMKALEQMAGEYLPCVKLITIAPELEGAMTFVQEAASRGIHVSVGHTSADARTVHQAADAGADHMTHTFNAQTALGHREPGVPGAALSDDRIYAEFIADGVHIHSDVLKIAYRCKGEGKMVLVTDAMEAAGMPEGTYALGGQTVYVKGNAARLGSGVLAGSTLLMREAVGNMVALGVPLLAAAKMATQTPALCIGNTSEGVLKRGAHLPVNRYQMNGKYIESIVE